MLFTIGVEIPKNQGDAYGLVVPALCNEKYGCFSAADTQADILPMVSEAIRLMLEDMADNNEDLSIDDKGFQYYQSVEDYQYCDTWLLIDIDVSEFLSKKQRVNISLPQYLLNNIDKYVSAHPNYRDRSHFLAVAAQKVLFNDTAQT